MVYRCEATSVEGFVQQLAVSYIAHGYWFYVTGVIPERKNPAAVDQKLINRYGIDLSRWARARRKCAGLANVHYLRHNRFFVVIATAGDHRFFEEEKEVKDVRRDSIRFDHYAIGYKRDRSGKWHTSVRLHPDTYRAFKSHVLDLAVKRRPEELATEFLQFTPMLFAPVRAQLLCVYRAVNEVRKRAGLDEVPRLALPNRRRAIHVFSVGERDSSPRTYGSGTQLTKSDCHGTEAE